jgi:hypothetical protein
VSGQVLALVDVAAIAAAAATGWPAKVKPCENDALSCMNGSAMRSETIIAPIGT